MGADGGETNLFQWNLMRLNMPGPSYDVFLTWIANAKLRKDGRMACNLFKFIDDERVVVPDVELCWQACHVLAAKLSYLGIMDAPRKFRAGSKTPGAWAGAVVHMLMFLGVCALTSEDKWKRLKALLAKWLLHLEAGVTELSHKELASDRGFMVYVTRTYPPMVPYLKGFYLAMEVK